MIKKIFKRLLIILCTAIFGFIIYAIIDIFFGKYLLPDWDFSKAVKIDQTLKPRPQIDSSFLEYKIYYNGEIDYTLKFYNNGIVSYQDSSWFTDRISKSPVYFTKIDDSELNELLKAINEIKDDSEGSSVEDHFSGYYYTMTIHKTNKGQLFNKEIGYYNTNPDRVFKRLKRDILGLLKNRKWNKTAAANKP
jgi:hypothetical protein